jgi:hypothetical protein
MNYYGSNATRKSILHHYGRDIKPNVMLLKEAFESGNDPKDVVIVMGVREGRPGKRQALTLLFCFQHTHVFLPSADHPTTGSSGLQW